MSEATIEEPVVLERGETGMRILVTLLFFVITRIVGIVLAIVVVYELLWTLITREPPQERVRQFANRTLAYLYESVRWMTYNRAREPFPFEDFPPEVDPIPELTDDGDDALELDEDEEEAG